MFKAKKIIAIFLMLSAANSCCFAEDEKVKVLWYGLFGEYSKHPLPNDPLPNVTLFPFGEIPRPLLKTTRIPAKIGNRFGVLLVFPGERLASVHFRYVVHYPSPGITERPDEKPALSNEVPLLCFRDLPCYVGYQFQNEQEMLPGEWRIELFLGDKRVHESAFIVESGVEREYGI